MDVVRISMIMKQIIWMFLITHAKTYELSKSAESNVWGATIIFKSTFFKFNLCCFYSTNRDLMNKQIHIYVTNMFLPLLNETRNTVLSV